MTIKEALGTISGYPIDVNFLEITCKKHHLSPSDSVDGAISSKGYALAQADCMRWLANAPNVSQEGISYSLAETDKKRFLRMAASIYELAGEDQGNVMVFGYKGARL